MSSHGLETLLKSISSKRILVIGDLMLDQYQHGKVNRISPEAPVPILEMISEEYRLGGAANAVLNVKTMGCIPIPLGICGNDASYQKIIELLNEENIITDGIISVPDRITTVKTRIVAGQQHVVRIDKEQRDAITTEMEDVVISKFKELITNCDAVIIEDYNKGLLTARVIESILEIAREKAIPITVDPKYNNFFAYKNVTVFKPNFKELKDNMALPIKSDADFIQAGHTLREKLDADNVMVTRGEKGLSVFKSDGSTHSIPTYAIDVFDVSGAGDTVISALTIALACGSSIETAAELANYAAGIVCGKAGTSTTKPSEILEYIKRYEDS